jgi:hypothetical protein
MTTSPRALQGAISRPNVPASEVRHTLQSARADEWRSGPVGTVRAGHHDRCLGRSQQGSEEGATSSTRKPADRAVSWIYDDAHWVWLPPVRGRIPHATVGASGELSEAAVLDALPFATCA